MKKLFSVNDSHSKSVVKYFDDKMKAKEFRNKANPERSEDFVLGTKERFFIAKGPDHKDFKV